MPGISKLSLYSSGRNSLFLQKFLPFCPLKSFKAPDLLPHPLVRGSWPLPIPWDESGVWVVHLSVLPLKLSRSCSASGIKKKERRGREEFTISGTSLKRSNARILHFQHLLLSSSLMPAAGALRAAPFPKILSSTCSGTLLTSLIPSEQISPLAGPACSALVCSKPREV